jgi:uncharacterized protein YjbJ (UPF0337 family)
MWLAKGQAMEWTAIEAGWNQLYKGNAQRRFNKLTRADVEDTRAKRERLVDLVRTAYGLSEEKAEAQIADWQSRQRPVRILIDEPW